MSRNPLTDPREGDEFTCARGDIRIDRVKDGWVYFVQWPTAVQYGHPTRMQMETWLGCVAEYGLTAKEEHAALGAGKAGDRG